MSQNMIKDFLESARNADPEVALGYGLLTAFFTAATLNGAFDGRISGSYVTGTAALISTINLIRHLRGEKAILTSWDAPTSSVAAIAVTAPAAIGLDVMLSQSYTAEQFAVGSGLAVISLVSVADLKSRFWPNRSNQASSESTPS